MTVALRELGADELSAWDAAAVDAPGGHVYQSRAWAKHRTDQGWVPRFLAAGDVRTLALVRRGAAGGGYARIPRGPVGVGTPWTGDGSGAAIGETLAAAGRWLADAGIDVVVADPEVAATDAAYRRAIDGAGFHPVEEIQPSRHRLALSLAGVDEAAVLAGISKQTRQRIRQAERGAVTVVRRDRGPDPSGWTPPPDLVRASGDEAVALERFYAMLIATGERRSMDLRGSDDFTAWWARALAAGHLCYLEARDGGPDGDILGGLVLYRHGRRLSTAHSADVADGRRAHPGTMHLLRWRAIQLALAEGRTEMDLAGVDVPGARRPPEPGEPTYGLYEHKRSFGAEWIELAGARELVARPWLHAARRLLSGAARTLRPGDRA